MSVAPSSKGNNGKSFLKAKTHFFKNLDLNQVLETEDPKSVVFTGTKVIATIGPACQDVDTLAQMLTAGCTGYRVDLTWGPLDFHRKSLENLQEASYKARRLAANMVDILGREVMIRRQVRIGEDGWPVHDGSFAVASGSQVTLTVRADAVAGVTGTSCVLPVTYAKFNQMVEPGDTVYVGRYLVSGGDSASLYLQVQEVVDEDIICVAKNEAVLDGLLTVFHAERSSDTLLNVQNELPVMSEYDKECLTILAQDYEIDFVSLSFTKTASDVRDARSFLNSIGMGGTKILAKIETRQSLLNFRSILSVADGIIISRGNLGLDCAPEKMALVQKTLIQACNLMGKPVIITRVVDTMASTPRPTRAEATDVANAVLDSVDGIMLGAETLRGKYPLETIETISRISRAAEKVFDHHFHYEHLMELVQEEDDDDEADEAPGDASDIGDDDLSNVDAPPAGFLTGGANGHGKIRRDDSNGGPADFKTAMKSMAHVGSSVSLGALQHMRAARTSGNGSASPYAFLPLLSKMESIASSAVRCADKVQASLIVVYTFTGKTAQLVAKYRPPMPILTLVVPHLISNSLKWKLAGRSNARQCLLSRGLLPMLAAPSPSGEQLLEEAIILSGRMGLVKAHDHVVCVQRVHDDFCVKIISVDDAGFGIKKDTSFNTPAGMGSPFGDHYTRAPPPPSPSGTQAYLDQPLGATLSAALPATLAGKR